MAKCLLVLIETAIPDDAKSMEVHVRSRRSTRREGSQSNFVADLCLSSWGVESKIKDWMQGKEMRKLT